MPQIVIFFTSVTGTESFAASWPTARLWSRRVIAVKRVGSIFGALFIAMRQFVFAGLPTTRILMSLAALSESALPCPVKMLPLIVEQVGALHPRLAGHRSDEKRVVRIPERGVRVVGLHDALEERERAVLELHGDAAERVERRGDLEQLEDDRLIRAEHLAGRDAEQQAVADLSRGSGDGDAYGCRHAPHPTEGVRGCRARSRRARCLELQRLDLEELLETERAELASVTRLLVAAERRHQVEATAVHLDLPGAHLAGDLLGALLIARPHAAGQAVDRVVGDLDGLVLVS